MVRIHPDPPLISRRGVASQSRREGATCTRAYTRARATKCGEARGAVAQLGEHLLCKQGVVGSIPSSSTIDLGIESQCGGKNPEVSGSVVRCSLLLVSLKPEVIGCSLTIRKK